MKNKMPKYVSFLNDKGSRTENWNIVPGKQKENTNYWTVATKRGLHLKKGDSLELLPYPDAGSKHGLYYSKKYDVTMLLGERDVSGAAPYFVSLTIDYNKFWTKFNEETK